MGPQISHSTSGQTDKANQATSRTVILAGSFVVFFGLLVIIELFSLVFFQVTKDLPAFRLRVSYPVELTTSEIQSYLMVRDENLGWPPTNAKYLSKSTHGERFSPANKSIEHSKYCMEVYGDSFTFSSDVDDYAAWPNQITEKTKCKVLNFGVGGYGVDQAVLRHQLNDRFSDHATLVIYPDDITRNLNQHRSLISAYKNQLDFKPRFVLSGAGGLKYIGPFRGKLGEYKKALEYPEQSLHHERFLPETSAILSKVIPSFPFSLSLFRFGRRLYREIDFETIRTGEIRRGLSGTNFVTYHFSNEKLAIEAKLILERLVDLFQGNCRKKKQTCFVVLLPDLDYLEGSERATLLIDYYFQNIRNTGSYFDMVQFLRSEMKGQFCRYIKSDNCWGHFNESGYEIVSKYFAREFSDIFSKKM